MNLENRIKSLIPPDLTNIIKNRAEINKRKKGTNGTWYCPQYTICSSSDFTNMYNYFRIGEFLIPLYGDGYPFLANVCVFKDALRYSNIEEEFLKQSTLHNKLEKFANYTYYFFPFDYKR